MPPKVRRGKSFKPEEVGFQIAYLARSAAIEDLPLNLDLPAWLVTRTIQETQTQRKYQ